MRLLLGKGIINNSGHLGFRVGVAGGLGLNFQVFVPDGTVRICM